MILKVNEIFYSIQGESLYAGLPCVFIRLTGCNLRCLYCDTTYAYNDGTEMTIPDILSKISTYKSPLIEITGGEPLIQENTPALVDNLIKNKYKVLIETNGSKDISIINNKCIKIVDIKCPSSNEKSDLNNIGKLQDHDQLKFVIQDRKDYEYAKKIVMSGVPIPLENVLFSTVHKKLALDKLAKWILDDNLNVRFHIQIHKFIWPDIERGV